MKHFKVFPGNNTEPLALELNHVLAIELDHPFTPISFFDQFNQDVTNINDILDHLISLEVYQSAFELQEEHNDIREKSHLRWVNSGSNYSVGVNAVKHLLQKADQYKKALQLKKQFELKQKKIQDYLLDATWHPILNLAKELGHMDAVRSLKQDWMQQQEFASCNSQELAQILKKLNKLNSFLKLIQSLSYDHVEISQIAERNQALLDTLNKQITVAISWRIHAASLRNNLWFDDALWALHYTLTHLLRDYEPGNEHLELQPPLLSRALTPDVVKVFLKHLQEIEKTLKGEELLKARCKDKWLGCRWITDLADQYALKVVITPDLEILPKLLTPFIPSSGDLPDNFIPYFHFRGKAPDKPLARLLKKKLLGNSYETLIFLNEAIYQVSAFEKVAKTKPMVFSKMTQTPGFKSALLLPYKIELERRKMQCLTPKALSLKGLTWVPRVVFLAKTQQFWEAWESVLTQIEAHIYDKGCAIIPRILLSLEKDLIQTIKEAPLSFPKDWISDVYEFVEYYGTPLQKEQVKTLLSPFYLFNQFQFVIGSPTDMAKQLDQKAVDTFLSYARAYWTLGEYEAAKSIAALLQGYFPPTLEERRQLLSTLSIWFSNTPNPHRAVTDFLNRLGLEVIVKIGSRSNTLAFEFLKEYSPSAMKMWEKERHKDLNKKYSLLVSALQKKVGSEVNLYTRDEGVEIEFMDDLKRDPSGNHYTSALADALQDYLRQYGGQNGAYATWVFHHFEKHRLKYFKARIDYLLKNPNSPKLVTQELSLYETQNTILTDLLKQALLSSERMAFKTFNSPIYSMISASHNKELEGIYHFKRVNFLLEEGSFNTLHEETYFFDKENPTFQSYFNEYGRKYIHKYSFNIAPLDDRLLEWTIEFYGDQRLKEENRYLAIKRFLDAKYPRSMVEFLKKMKVYLVSDNITDLFTLDEYKSQLAALYHSYNRQGWNAYAQALMEQLTYPQTELCLFGARLAWLNQLLFQSYPALLSDSVVLGMHTKNWEAPIGVSLTSFFGPLLNQAKEKVNQYLSGPCKIEAAESKIILIGRYVEDESFKGDDQWEQWSFKIEVLKVAYGIVALLKKKAWDEAKRNFYQLHTALKSDGYLRPYQDEEIKLKKRYYEQVFQALKDYILENKDNMDPMELEVQGITALLQMSSLSPLKEKIRTLSAHPLASRRRSL